MQDIGIGTGRSTVVDRPEGSQTVCLTFRGRVMGRARDRQPEILAILEAHRGETGADEAALEVVQRLSRGGETAHPREVRGLGQP